MNKVRMVTMLNICLVNSELKGRMGIDTSEIVFSPDHDGTVCTHPGQESNHKQTLPGVSINSVVPVSAFGFNYFVDEVSTGPTIPVYDFKLSPELLALIDELSITS